MEADLCGNETTNKQRVKFKQAFIIDTSLARIGAHNARHHPRPYSTIMKGSVMGRRVHAVVVGLRSMFRSIND